MYSMCYKYICVFSCHKLYVYILWFAIRVITDFEYKIMIQVKIMNLGP